MRRILALFAAAIAGLACSDSPPTGLGASEPDNAPSQGGLINPFGATATRVDLGTLGGASSYATDINNSNVVVGWSHTTGGTTHAFRWTSSGGMMDLGTLPNHDWSRAIAIDDNGTVLGLSGSASASQGTTVTWSPNGAITPLLIPQLPGASYGEPTDFNSSGHVVGWDVLATQHAWHWSTSAGTFDITASAPGASEGASSQINAADVVVGSTQFGSCTGTPQCFRAFLWSLANGYTSIPVPNNNASVAVTGLGVNNANEVVGWIQTAGGPGLQPYRWSNGRGYTMLPVQSSGYALAINGTSTAVGANFDPNTGAAQAVAWPAGGGIIVLSPNETNSQLAVAVNESNKIVGWSSLDAMGETAHASMWTLQSTVGVRLPQILRPLLQPLLNPSLHGAAACTVNLNALFSRATLLACVASSSSR